MPAIHHATYPDDAPSVSHNEYRGKSLRQCFFRRFIRCPRLLSKCARPVVQNNGQSSSPTSSASPPVQSLPAVIAPCLDDVTLPKLMQKLRNKERPTHDIIEMLGLLLNMDDFVNLSDKIDNQQDAENMIEILLYLFDIDLIGQMGMGLSPININRARRLVIKITQRLITPPKFLFLNPDEIPIPTGLPIGEGGLAFVYKSSYRGLHVALKCFRSGKIDKDFLQEALTWRTLSHKHILPFIGIFVDHSQESQSFISLVAPFMENGTLRNWRQNTMPSIAEIKKRIQEVAEGLLYLHTEGVVHGDLKGTNVLLDSEFHVKISDFGSTRHSDSTGTKTWGMTIRFAAPELFFDEEDQALLKRTREGDIYAFGCLYYEIHFGVLPFSDTVNVYSIIKQVKEGTRPILHGHPRLDDDAKRLITQCWDQDPSERPRIEDVVDKFMCFGL